MRLELKQHSRTESEKTMSSQPNPAHNFSLQATFSLGFRPFYWAGAFYAVISLLLWTGYLLDVIELKGPFDGLMWHAHELIFGFAVAILVGFLFTAVKNWTRLPTPTGLSLAALLCLWAAGRLMLIFGSGPLVPIIDLLFLPLAALGIAIPLIKSGNRRNYFTFLLMLVLTLANAGFYAVAYGWLEAEASTLFVLAVDVFAIFITIIGGRIIPLFTNNATGSKRAKRHPKLEYAIVTAMGLVLVSDMLYGVSDQMALPRAVLLLALTALHVAKIMCWRPHITRTEPMLWILPVAYSWLPIAFLLRALSLLGAPIDQILALHALTIGAMGGMMLAMMTRSSLGHTGRKIVAGKAESLIFVLITLGAIIRVLAPILLPQYYLLEIALSAIFWSMAFGLFCMIYWPILTRPRV